MPWMRITDHRVMLFGHWHQNGGVSTSWLSGSATSRPVTHQVVDRSAVWFLYNGLVMLPYTVKIRGGRLGRIIEMSSCPATQPFDIRGRCSILPRHSQAHVLPSHAVKTKRGCSTLHQAHALPPHTNKTRVGSSKFYHHQSYSDMGNSICQLWAQSHQWITLPKWNICTRDPRYHTIRMPPNLSHSPIAPWLPLHWQNLDIQEQTWSYIT